MSKKIHPANAKIAQELLHKELFEKLNPVIKQGIISIWIKAVTFSDSSQYEGQPTLLIFQKFLQDIQDWNNLTIERETGRIKEEVRKKCIDDGEDIDDNWFEDIVGQIFISYAVIYESIKIKGTRPNIKLPVPDMNKLTHKIYIDIAEKIFKEPYIIQESNSLQERNEKDEKLNLFIKESIIDVIRRTFPHSQIRKEYTGGVMQNVKTAGDIVSSDEEAEGEAEDEVEVDEDTESEPEENDKSALRPLSMMSPRTIKVNPNMHKISKSFSPRPFSRHFSPGLPQSPAPAPAPAPVPAPAPAPAPAPWVSAPVDDSVSAQQPVREQDQQPTVDRNLHVPDKTRPIPGIESDDDTDTETDSD